MRTIVASRCTLEPQVAAHAREMFAVLGDPAIYEYENAPPISEEWLTERYRRLEGRGPPGGGEIWLNWVIRLDDGRPAGYVQATLLPDRASYVAYELNSAHWGQGIGSSAVAAMLQELHEHHAVDTFIAVLKQANHRSAALLRHLGFVPAADMVTAAHRDEPDEWVFVKAAGDVRPAA